MYTYEIVAKFSNEKDERAFGRTLNMNSWESAVATYKTLVKAAMEEVIDGYVITLTRASKDEEHQIFYFRKD